MLTGESLEKRLDVSMVKTVSVQDHQMRIQAKRKAPIARMRNSLGWRLLKYSVSAPGFN